MSYSVIIRTLSGGEKYSHLLESLSAQTIRPEHVYIIQPYGYEPPKERLGYEEFIPTNKGMWEQRIYGMEYSFSQPNHSKYLLVCDDDIEFQSNFIAELIDIAEKYSCDTLIPIQDYRAGWIKNLYRGLLGERTENRRSKFKISIKKNGRFSVNNDLKDNVNPTQSGPFQCFLMRTDITPILNLRDEMWLDGTRYAWPDDQVFFYKSHLLGLKNYSCKTPTFRHLDGKAGVSDRQRLIDATYSRTRNIIIFWRKFIKSQQVSFISKINTELLFRYYIFINSLPFLIKGLKSLDFSLFHTYRKGIKDGYDHIL